MDVVLPILLLILGLLFVVGEVFIPSFGILTFLATASVVASVVLAFLHLTFEAGMVFVVAVIILVPTTLVLSFKIFPRTPFGKRLILDGPSFADSQGSATVKALGELVGQQGVALSDLRPAGMARINDQRVDVVTRGVMLDKDTPLKVVMVEGNRVVVEKLES